MTDRPYQKLIAWKESYALCLVVYTLTKKFPLEERFALADQVGRASSSVPITIAEGDTKRSRKDRVRFFEIALAALNELHCASLLARNLRYCTDGDFQAIGDYLQRTSYLLTKLHLSVSVVPSPP